MKKLVGLTLALGAVPLLAGEVTFKDTTTVLPTYMAGGFDKTPVFYTGRVYQGAQGRIYPYPMQDVLTDEKQDETYRYLTLENDWLHLGVLPEHGGHLLNLTDKKTGFETFYRQHVVKPALIGMVGAWISGGVEWNFPHHHRASSSMPVDWKAETRDPSQPDDFGHAAGTKTIWLGETELRRRLKWTIGLSLMPDRAVLEAQNIFMNRGPYIESMLYWANVAANCGDDYQVIFPPSCHLGFDHHKRTWTSFPMGPRTTRKGDDSIVDLGWWKNFTSSSRSIFAMDPDNAWLVGYDHGKDAGTAHLSNRHITVGKKFFLWGNFPAAQMWDSIVLTDTDGPYLELMVGCWSDNQPDYSWIAPYETRKVKQFWYPVKGIGGVKNVTIDGAVNVERRGKDEFLVGFHSTRTMKGCTITFTENGRTVFSAKDVAIDPDHPWCRTVKVSEGVKDQAYTAAIADADGKTFVSYTPVGPDPHDPLPPEVDNPKDPKDYSSAELAYLVGLRLEQFHNGVVDPVPYYERALEIDPDYSAANVAMGLGLMKRGLFAKAEGYLRRASNRVTQNYTRAKDAEPEYLLALCLEEQGRLKEAEDLFWRVTWRATHKKEAFFEIARICCRQGRYREAHDVLEFNALPLAQDEAKVHTLHAYIHRKLKDSPEAIEMHRRDWKRFAANNQAKAFVCDPLEYWGVCEAAFRENGGKGALAAAEENRGIKAQQLIETLCDYAGLGAWDETVALCDQALAKAAAEKPYRTEGALPIGEIVACCDSYRSPMIGYFKAYALAKAGKADEARAALETAAAMSTDYCFPSRLEELAALEWAHGIADAAPAGRANTCYYLGEILWNFDRKDEAVAVWREAAKLAPEHALVLRCLGFALTHPGSYFESNGISAGVASEEGAAFYRRAIAANPHDARTLLEADLALRRVGTSTADRLALMNAHRATAEKYDPCVVRIVELCIETGDYDEAIRLLSGRHFHIWEGGVSLRDIFVDALVKRGDRKLAAKDFAGARQDYERALTYPVNLEAARPNHAGLEPRIHWALARCAKAAGDESAWRRALENTVRGEVRKAEMNVFRAQAFKALGRAEEVEKEIAVIEKEIAELGKPQPRVINAYAKFAGEQSPDERAAERAKRAARLKASVAEIRGK